MAQIPYSFNALHTICMHVSICVQSYVLHRLTYVSYWPYQSIRACYGPAMLEQMGDSPFTAQQVKYFTARDPCLSQVLTYVQKGWPDRVQEEQLKPYWHHRTELTSHDSCLLWDSVSLSHHKAGQQSYRSYMVDIVVSPG